MKGTFVLAVASALLLAPTVSSAQTRDKPSFVTVQPADQWLASQLMGQAITNEANESVGSINDLLFDRSGRIANVVIGVGGFLGIGEKNVAVPFGSLEITAAADGKRVVKASLSRQALEAAPEFTAREKTTYMRAKEQATEMGKKAMDKASEYKDKAARKLDEMRSNETK